MLKDKVTAYVALGSNLGDRYANLDAAESAVASAAGVYLDRSSPTYESPAADVPGQPPFLNRILAVQIWLGPRELLQTCKSLEIKLGREPGTPKGPRAIDIDVLLYGDAVVAEDDLMIPHAALARRPFFLQPLKDIAGDIYIPGTSQNISKFLAALAPYDLKIYRPGY